MDLLLLDHHTSKADMARANESLRMKIKLLKDNIGKQVSFSIGNSWHHGITVKEVNEDEARFLYSDANMPKDSWMEIKYIDQLKARS